MFRAFDVAKIEKVFFGGNDNIKEGTVNIY